MTIHIQITSAFGNKDNAKETLKLLLEKKLVSCGQISQIESSYWWHESINNSTEYLLTCKTIKTNYNAIEMLIKEKHEYETPQIIAIEINCGEKGFLKWIEDSVEEAVV